MTDFDRTHRRDFLGKAAALAAWALTMPALLEATPRDALMQDSNDAWLERITGKHRQLFDIDIKRYYVAPKRYRRVQ